MKTTSLLLAAGLMLAPAMHAQADPSNYLDESQLELRRYIPAHVHADSLFQTLDSMFGRELRFSDRMIDNLAVLEDSIVIYDTTERLGSILQAIAELDVDAYAKDEAEADARDDTDHFTRAQMSLQSYMPRYVQAIELYDLASDLYGRQVVVDDEWQDNLRLTQRAILVYEEKQAADGLMQRLVDLDESQAPEQAAALKVLEYRPRHLSPNGLLQGMQPFRAMVNDYQNGSFSQTPNLTLLEESGILLIRDYETRAKQILDALERLDQPAPQVILVCQVLRGVSRPTDRPADAGLQEQLRKLLPHEHYEIEASGMLRTGAVAGNDLELELESAAEGESLFRLSAEVGNYDAKSGALGLNRCRFMVQSPRMGNRNLFSTTTTVFRGEQAVLGVAGAEPLFLVVQFQPVGGQVN